MEVDAQEIVSEDVSGVSQDHLNARDAELRTVYSYLKRRAFLLPRVIRRVAISTETEPKGHLVSDKWFRRVIVTGLQYAEVLDIHGFVRENNWTVSVNEVKNEDEQWSVEIL